MIQYQVKIQNKKRVLVDLERSLIRFEYKKSPLHSIFYGGTGTGKIYFDRQSLKLYEQQTLTEGLSRTQIEKIKLKLTKTKTMS